MQSKRKHLIAMLLICSAISAGLSAHYMVVHGGGVNGEPQRCLAAWGLTLMNRDVHFPDDAITLIREGAMTEDVPWASTFNHFYNPHTGLNTYPRSRMTALESATQHWEEALRLHREGALTGPDGAWHRLGETLHLLQDMASPSHIHDDVHFLYIDTDDFENAAIQIFPSLTQMNALDLSPTLPSGEVTLPGGEIVPALSVPGIVQTLADFSYELTCYEGTLIAEEGEQPDSELKRMFPSLHYDANLGAWMIDDIGFCDPNEKRSDWHPCQGDSEITLDDDSRAIRITGNFYIETVGNARPAAFERPLRHTEFEPGMLLVEVWSLELFPEAARQTAILLELYQRLTEE